MLTLEFVRSANRAKRISAAVISGYQENVKRRDRAALRQDQVETVLEKFHLAFETDITNFAEDKQSAPIQAYIASWHALKDKPEWYKSYKLSSLEPSPSTVADFSYVLQGEKMYTALQQASYRDAISPTHINLTDCNHLHELRVRFSQEVIQGQARANNLLLGLLQTDIYRADHLLSTELPWGQAKRSLRTRQDNGTLVATEPTIIPGVEVELHYTGVNPVAAPAYLDLNITPGRQLP